MTWRERWQALERDHLSGPAAIVQQVAEALAAFADEQHGASLPQMRHELSAAAHDLLKTHIANAPVVGLLNRAFLAYSSETEAGAALAALGQAVDEYARGLIDQRPLLDRRAVAMIPTGVTVMTHGHSISVKRALVAAQQAGRAPRVICAETRPHFQGRRLAADLAEAGLAVTLIVDAAIHANFGQVEMVLIGCDSMSAHGLVGRIGAGQIAFIARAHGTPVYVVSHTSKIWPADLGVPILTERPAAEVWEAAPPNVEVQRRCFEMTAWPGLAGVITERGLLTSEEIQALSREKPVHAELLNIVGEIRRTLT